MLKLHSLADRFYKVEATGNDFVMFVDLGNHFQPSPDDVRKICDRHFGIGGDGLIRVGMDNDNSDNFFMDYFNADGSLAQMCGNGVRSVAALIDELDLHNFNDKPAQINTRGGLKIVTSAKVESQTLYTVDMGKWSADDGRNIVVNFGQSEFSARFVDMGNEHLVINFARDEYGSIESIDLTSKPEFASNKKITDKLVVERVLKAGANVEFSQQFDERRIDMRVYERGVGETLSCGTGVCATAISHYLEQFAAGEVDAEAEYIVNVRGGQLNVQVTPENVILTGPAKVVAKFDLNSICDEVGGR